MAPGAVGREAASRARLAGWLGVVFTALFASLTLFFALTMSRDPSGCRCQVVVATTSAVGGINPFFQARSTTGFMYTFYADPHLVPGDSFIAVFDSDGTYLSAEVDGEWIRSISNASGPRDEHVSGALLIAFSVPMVLLLILCERLSGWSFANLRAIWRDLAVGPTVVRGRYEGSWIPRSLLMNASQPSGFGAMSRLSSGFPVLMTASDGPRWLHVPVSRAEELRTFEEALRHTDQHVEVACYPNTGVVTTITGPGGVVVDLSDGGDVDVWDPEVGMPLPTRKRRRR